MLIKPTINTAYGRRQAEPHRPLEIPRDPATRLDLAHRVQRQADELLEAGQFDAADRATVLALTLISGAGERA